MTQHMNYKPDNNSKSEEILNSLDGIRRAAPQPYFYTRLMARMNDRDGRWEKIVSLISRPAFAIAVIVLFLFMNVVILYNSSSGATQSQDESSLAIENDYELSVPSLYDINPEQSDVAQK